jgi:hypothetical protein
MNFVEKMVGSQPNLVTFVRSRIEASKLELEKVLSNTEQIFSAPKSALNRLEKFIDRSVALAGLLGITLPAEMREKLAQFAESELPLLVRSMTEEISAKVEKLEVEPGTLTYFRYFMAAERAVPFSTFFVFTNQLRDDAVWNGLPLLKPEPELEVDAEARSRRALDRSALLLIRGFFPFMVDPLTQMESIQAQTRIHTLREGAAVDAFNRSVAKRGAEAPEIPKLLVHLRHSLAHNDSHPGVSGSFLLKEKTKGAQLDGAQAEEAPVLLSGERVAGLPSEIIRSIMQVQVALGLVAFWRLLRDGIPRNWDKVLAAALRDLPEPESQLDETLVDELNARLDRIGLTAGNEAILL